MPVADVPRAVAFYKRLGFRQIVASPHYARFECRRDGPSFSVHLVDRVLPDSGVVVYFECDDLDARCVALEKQGVQFESAPRDQAWLWREAYLKDPDGNRLCLYHAGTNRLNPPWRID